MVNPSKANALQSTRSPLMVNPSKANALQSTRSPLMANLYRTSVLDGMVHTLMVKPAFRMHSAFLEPNQSILKEDVIMPSKTKKRFQCLRGPSIAGTDYLKSLRMILMTSPFVRKEKTPWRKSGAIKYATGRKFVSWIMKRLLLAPGKAYSFQIFRTFRVGASSKVKVLQGQRVSFSGRTL